MFPLRNIFVGTDRVCAAFIRAAAISSQVFWWQTWSFMAFAGSSFLKGNSTNFTTFMCVNRSLGVLPHMWKKVVKSISCPLPEEAAFSLINSYEVSGIMGNVGTMFWKGKTAWNKNRWFLWFWCTDVEHLFINYMTPNKLIECFSNYVAYIAHNATGIVECNLSYYMWLHLEPQKALYYFFHICSSTPQPL